MYTLKEIKWKIGALPDNWCHPMHIEEIYLRYSFVPVKAHFLSVLAGVDPTFPKFLWDNLLVQKELTLNLLLQDTLNPLMSSWGYFNGAFDYGVSA